MKTSAQLLLAAVAACAVVTVNAAQAPYGDLADYNAQYAETSNSPHLVKRDEPQKPMDAKTDASPTPKNASSFEASAKAGGSSAANAGSILDDAGKSNKPGDTKSSDTSSGKTADTKTDDDVKKQTDDWDVLKKGLSSGDATVSNASATASATASAGASAGSNDTKTGGAGAKNMDEEKDDGDDRKQDDEDDKKNEEDGKKDDEDEDDKDVEDKKKKKLPFAPFSTSDSDSAASGSSLKDADKSDDEPALSHEHKSDCGCKRKMQAIMGLPPSTSGKKDSDGDRRVIYIFREGASDKFRTPKDGFRMRPSYSMDRPGLPFPSLGTANNFDSPMVMVPLSFLQMLQSKLGSFGPSWWSRSRHESSSSSSKTQTEFARL